MPWNGAIRKTECVVIISNASEWCINKQYYSLKNIWAIKILYALCSDYMFYMFKLDKCNIDRIIQNYCHIVLL